MGFETEVKFHVDTHAAVLERLVSLGAERVRPRTYERNVVYDRPDFRLRDGDCLLRLRQDERCRLTFKGPAEADAGSEAKVREEIEVETADFDVMDQLLQKLDYEPKIVYEKYRETFHVGGVEVVLDELPYGNFVELEGEEREIKRLAGDLGLEWSRRLLTNYLALMQQIKKTHNLPFDDITFEKFETILVSELIISN